MKKILLFFAIAAAALLSSCAKENISPKSADPQGRIVEITAGMEETKVNVGTDGKVTWTENDTIAAFNTAGTKFLFHLVSGAGTTSAVFRCDNFTGTLGKAAVYPYTYAGNAEGTIVYPSVKYYNSSEQVPVVMAASLSGSSVNFVQMGGVIELNMYDIPAYTRVMRVKSGSFGISGTYSFNATAPEAISAATGYPSSVEIRFPVKTGYRVNTKFCFPVPVGNYDDLFVQFLDGDEDIIEGTEFIKIPNKYGAIKARDYVSMAQMDVRSKVTRSGYIKVEGVKWATGNLRAWNPTEGGVDGKGWQTGWNVYDNQYESAYQHITDAIDGSSTGVVTSGNANHFDHFNYGGLGRTSRVQNSVYMCPATAKEDIAGRIFDSSAKNGDAEALAAAEKAGDERFVESSGGTFVDNLTSICGDIAFWASKGQMRLPRSSEVLKLRAGNAATTEYANCRAGYYMDGTKVLRGLLFTSTASWETSVLNQTSVEFSAADLESGLFIPKVGMSVNGDGYKTGLKARYVNGQMCYGTSTFGSLASGFEDCLTVIGSRASNTVDYGYTLNYNSSKWGQNLIVRNVRPVLYNPSDEIKQPKPAPTSKSLTPWKKGQMDIHFINTGRGECHFIIMPDGTSIIIDAGECGESEEYVSRKPSNVTTDPNYCRVYKAYTTYMKYFLQNTKHNYIDYAIATHYHIDHIGAAKDNYKKSASGNYICTGLSAIYEDLPIKKLVDRYGPGVGYDDFTHKSEDDLTRSVYDNYIAFAGEKQTKDGMGWYKVNSSASGMDAQFALKYDTSYSASLKVIGYNFKYWNGSSFVQLDDALYENGRSITTLLTYGAFNCYFGADCHAEYTPNIMQYICNSVGKVEVLKAPHHMATDGSLTTSQTSVLQPKVTMVDVLSNSVPKASPAAAAKKYGDVFATNNEAGTSLKDYGGHFCIRVTDNGGTKTFMVYKLKDTDFSYEVLASYGPYSCH